MLALTLWQPYASAISLAATDPRGKLVENRTWCPPARVLGRRIAIHAGTKKPDPAWGLPPGAAELLGDFRALPRSAIVATAVVVGAITDDAVAVLPPEIRQPERARLCARLEAVPSSPWWVGPIGWLLDDVHACNVPCRGAMGLWTVPPDVERLVEIQTAGGAP